MAKYTEEAVAALELTDAQRLKAKRIFQGKKLSKSAVEIEAADEAALIAVLSVEPTGDGGKAKRDFNSKIIEAADKAKKFGFTQEQIVGAIEALCAEKVKEQTKEVVNKLLKAKGLTKEQILEALS